MKKIIIAVVMLMLMSTIFAGCTPSEFTKGVEVDGDYPLDVLEIYPDAVVFESEARFDKVKLSLGTKDDLEDIVEYYRDFYEYKNITPSHESLDDDEYSALFTVDGYEFEIEVTGADGEYVADLFEYVIEISSKKLVAEAASTKVGDENAVADDDPAMKSDDSPTSEVTAPPTQKKVLEGETAITSVATGAWYSYTVTDAAGSDKYVDYTIYFTDGTSGSYHYFDYLSGEKIDNEFTYEIANGVLVINLDKNVQLLYDAYYDNDQLHLINQYTDEAMYMKNWSKESGKTPNLTQFTAYGCWVTYLDGFSEPTVLALWEGGAGYVYNWNNDSASDNIMWKENGSSMSFEVGVTYGEDLELSHRGNVLKATQSDGEVIYFYRATTNMIASIYEITQTNDGDVGTWKATLSLDGTASHKISGGRLTFNYDNSNWYINPIDGMLYAFIFGEYASFYYYYNETEMILHEPTESLDYTFSKTQ